MQIQIYRQPNHGNAKWAEARELVPEVCRMIGVWSVTFYKRRLKFAGVDTSMSAELNELEAENI